MFILIKFEWWEKCYIYRIDKMKNLQYIEEKFELYIAVFY